MKIFTYTKEDVELTREELNNKYENNLLYWKDLCDTYGEGRELYKGFYENSWDKKIDFEFLEMHMPRLKELVESQNEYYNELPCTNESSKNPNQWTSLHCLLAEAFEMGVRGVLGELTDDDLDYNEWLCGDAKTGWMKQVEECA